MEHSRKKLDLTGQRFGRLTVIRPAENIGNRTAWLCRCDCGGEAVVKTYHLRSGKCGSCGCINPGFTGLTYVDGTCVEMLRAKTVRKNNTSGVPGVYWEGAKGMWRAAICFKGRRYSLGRYHRFEEAVKARKTAEEALHDKFLEEYASPGEGGRRVCLPSPYPTPETAGIDVQTMLYGKRRGGMPMEQSAP